MDSDSVIILSLYLFLSLWCWCPSQIHLILHRSKIVVLCCVVCVGWGCFFQHPSSKKPWNRSSVLNIRNDMSTYVRSMKILFIFVFFIHTVVLPALGYHWWVARSFIDLKQCSMHENNTIIQVNVRETCRWATIPVAIGSLLLVACSLSHVYSCLICENVTFTMAHLIHHSFNTKADHTL